MTELWIPSSAEELEAAVDSGTLVETHFSELKQFDDTEGERPKLPGTLAKTIAGLSVDGGVLILGVAENKAEHRFDALPQPLAGLREAVDQSALQAITPGLRVTTCELVRDDGTGYLVVIVPVSPRAPHMVDGRYYGRGDSTSRVLADVEVRALWERHFERRDRIVDLLAEEVAREPAPIEARTNARMFVVAQPVSADPRLLLDAVPNCNLMAWVQGLASVRLYTVHRPYAPTIGRASMPHRRARGVALTYSPMDSDRRFPEHLHDSAQGVTSTADLEYWEDGGLRLYYGRASDRHTMGDFLLLGAIAGEVAGVIEAARVVSETAGFHSSWQFGIALRGVRGLPAFDGGAMYPGAKFSEDTYDEVCEAGHTMLMAPDSPVLDALVGRLLRSLLGSDETVQTYDVFPQPAS